MWLTYTYYLTYIWWHSTFYYTDNSFMTLPFIYYSGQHYYNSDLYLMTLIYIFMSDLHLLHCYTTTLHLLSDLHMMTLTCIWWHWPTFYETDLHLMTLTYIWWHQSHWSGMLCRCPLKFYCPQTVTWCSSAAPLEPLMWWGVCTTACLWQTGPEHLPLQTQESWRSDWPTKRRGRDL